LPDIRKRTVAVFLTANRGAEVKGRDQPLNARATCKVTPKATQHAPTCHYKFHQVGWQKEAKYYRKCAESTIIHDTNRDLRGRPRLAPSCCPKSISRNLASLSVCVSFVLSLKCLKCLQRRINVAGGLPGCVLVLWPRLHRSLWILWTGVQNWRATVEKAQLLRVWPKLMVLSANGGHTPSRWSHTDRPKLPR